MLAANYGQELLLCSSSENALRGRYQDLFKNIWSNWEELVQIYSRAQEWSRSWRRVPNTDVRIRQNYYQIWL